VPHRFRSRAALLAVLLLAGCASDDVPVSVAFDPLATFPPQASFAWDRDAIVLPEDPRVRARDPAPLIEEVAEDAFAARGYERVGDPASADYLLSYHFQVTTFVAADASSSTAALSFLLTEPASSRRVWTGWGRAEYFPGAPRERTRARLAEAMEHLLEDFPPSRSGED